MPSRFISLNFSCCSGRERSIDLVVCCLVNCLLLGGLLLWGKRRVVADCLHLSRLILEDGLQFRPLILGKIQLLAEHLQVSLWRARAHGFVALR